jgi:hypothetical protein
MHEGLKKRVKFTRRNEKVFGISKRLHRNDLICCV